MSEETLLTGATGQLARAYRRVWATFTQLDTTADGRHDTPAWTARSAPYVACVVRVPAAALEPALGVLRDRLGQLPGVRVHPSYFLHATLQELGFCVDTPLAKNEISPARLEEFAQSAIEPISTTAPFPVTFGPVNSFQDAIFLEIAGGHGLIRLHNRLFELAAIPLNSDFAYLPHCTIAHYDGTASAATARAIIEPWRSQALGGFLVDEVEIVTLDPSQPYPALETFAVIPLGG